MYTIFYHSITVINISIMRGFQLNTTNPPIYTWTISWAEVGEHCRSSMMFPQLDKVDSGSSAGLPGSFLLARLRAHPMLCHNWPGHEKSHTKVTPLYTVASLLDPVLFNFPMPTVPSDENTSVESSTEPE